MLAEHVKGSIENTQGIKSLGLDTSGTQRS